MHSVLVVTISGDDRSGLVEELADVIALHGGNWEHSRMAHLAGHFVGLLQVSVPGDRQQDLEVAMRTIQDLDVMIVAGEAGEPGLVNQFDLEIVGSDHPGIVRDVFAALAYAKVNVEELSTSTETAPDTGATLFRAKARLACVPDADRDAIRLRLEEIAADILVDVRLLD
ncbi:glycine cleavage system protein R [Coraliomargarita parva]|uniref:glycine cleavage system protein R n=1 Tax=Coraliomargarita parva TaxID=3014050 RepID=UPI0022B3A6E1|nr:ACT domain-containing protein [Coraliomargarita parva]